MTPPEPDDLFADLTPEQALAVRTTEGPVLVLAAAGSGKTRVITRRIAHLVSCGIPAWSILALTFTNKAAGEMRDRVHAILGVDSRAGRGLTVTTFHALCARLLRRHADSDALPRLKPDFTIYPTDDQMALLKRLVDAQGLATSNWPPRQVLSAISNAKNELLDARAFSELANDFYQRTIAKLYTLYEEGLQAANAVDFDDLLLLTVELLRNDPEALEACRSRWTYLMIDEYQDTNRAQFEIASLLAGEGSPNIFVVGDPDQSIYGWRGADISNILDFEQHWPEATTITLGQNFRSTEHILGAADALIRHNVRRKHKDLYTAEEGGAPVEIVRCLDERHEARLVAEWIMALGHEQGLAWREMAVFYRTNALSRVMEDELRTKGIPYVIARGTAFFEREEVRNAIAYLRVVANPADDVSLLRIVNTPSRGIGATSLKQLVARARREGRPVMDVLRDPGAMEGVSSRTVAAINRFTAMLDGWTASGSFMGRSVPTSLRRLTEQVVRESGLEKMYADRAKKTDAEADEARVENLNELITATAQFEAEFDPDSDPVTFPGADVLERGDQAQVPPLLAMLRAYLEAVSLIADADRVDPEQGAVTLMTLHAAKGLEFPAVAVIGCEEGILPHSRSRESDEHLEEERRLCFVGMTRAMHRLLMTTARTRPFRGAIERQMESQFLRELDPEHVVVVDRAGDEFVSDIAPEVGGLGIGTVVRHPQFGLGRVEWLQSGRNARARIDFRGIGVKTLVLEYARLEVVEIFDD